MSKDVFRRTTDYEGSLGRCDRGDDYHAGRAALDTASSTSATSSGNPAGFVAAKLAEPTPSPLYTVIWQFAAKRHNLYLNRIADANPPWTDDEVLAQYRFTNTFRAADRVSQYLIGLAYHELKDTDPDSLFLSVLLFKIFNRIDTWEAIVDTVGLPDAATFDYETCDAVLSQLREQRPIYSAAYIMPSAGGRGTPKHRTHLELIRRMVKDGVPKRLQETTSLKKSYEVLLSYPSLGPFLAFQYAIDLNYTTLMSHGEDSFVVSGPGALDGLSKCFDSLGDYSAEDAIRWLSDRQSNEFEDLGFKFDGLWGRPLQLIDMQNVLCEVSKYTRATNPEVEGRNGRTRIKQRYSLAGRPVPRPQFPPKWQINESVASWLQERQVSGHVDLSFKQGEIPL